MAGRERIIATTVPHSSFGAPDCCGSLYVLVRGDHVDIMFNECESIVQSVLATELEQTFSKMEINFGLSSAVCPHCGAVELFPGFLKILAFTCTQCGALVNMAPQRKSAKA